MAGRTVSDTRSIESGLRSLLLGSFGLIAGAAILSAAPTQFVAYRVGYHPAIGSPWFGHLYAPWRWIEWQRTAWAVDAKRTFQIVDVGLFSAATAALFGALAYSSSIRRRPEKYEGVHLTTHGGWLCATSSRQQ